MELLAGLGETSLPRGNLKRSPQEQNGRNGQRQSYRNPQPRLGHDLPPLRDRTILRKQPFYSILNAASIASTSRNFDPERFLAPSCLLRGFPTPTFIEQRHESRAGNRLSPAGRFDRGITSYNPLYCPYCHYTQPNRRAMPRFFHAGGIHLDSPLKGLEAETVKLENLGVAINGQCFACRPFWTTFPLPAIVGSISNSPSMTDSFPDCDAT